MSRIGIFGGSFNPVHRGHIAIAKGVVESGLVDEVWLMVSPRNPLKQEADLMPDRQRLDRVRRAVRNIPHVEASDFEFQLPRPSYTYITLRRLREAYPDHDFTLLIGADNWQRFHLWRNHDELLRSYPIIIYPRKGCPIDENALPESVTFLNLPLLDVSSTQIRELMAQGKDVSHLIP